MSDPSSTSGPPSVVIEEDDPELLTGSEFELDEIGRARLPEGIEDTEPEDLAVALEAVCFALNRPVSLAEVGAILGRPGRAIAAAGEALAGQLRGRGLMLQRHRDEVQLVTRPEVAWAVQRALNPERPSRLSRPALETLAIIAYRQPVTRGVLEAIRGVNCDGVLENLERRGLVTEVGRSDGPGQPRLFGTTLRFLQLVGLERIEQLPPLPEGVIVPDFDDGTWSGALDPAPVSGGLDLQGEDPAPLGEGSSQGHGGSPPTPFVGEP